MPLLPEDALQELNAKVKERGSVDREHLLEFLAKLPTNDAEAIKREVQTWLQMLHDGPEYQGVRFAEGAITAILDDLASYGRVKAETLFNLQEPREPQA